MTEQQFLTRWQQEAPMYRVWGDAVVAEVKRQFEILNAGRKFDDLLKIPPKPRLKEDDSMLAKAFSSAKSYTNPYDQIEDKVGVRFVVLLTTDITLLKNAIESSTLWSCSKDKDFDKDRELRPQEFAYQSIHYVVRAASNSTVDGTTIVSGTPCEIQIRTLLQHAHSELTHDNVYKRDTASPVSHHVSRTVAKSMALIEAVDDFFERVIQQLDEASVVEKNALEDLCNVYKQCIGGPARTTKTDVLIVHAFKEKLPDELGLKLREFLKANSSVTSMIKSKQDRKVLFRSPSILLTYFMVHQHPELTKEIWPLTHEDIQPIYTDLGRRQ
jgi:putative GTP pyrophosphokinase